MYKIIEITIDSNTLNRYNQYYFNLHPRAKKRPIERPIHPSINKWMILKRVVMNNLKQKWKDFIVWVIKDMGYENLKIDKCEIEYCSYLPSKRRSDTDNFVPKFINDGLVESGIIVDDDYVHLRRIILCCGYDKDNPRTEIKIKILND